MKKTIPILLGILWLSLVASLAFMDGAGWSSREKMSLCQDGIKASDKVYVLENRQRQAVVYKIGESYQVEEIFFSDSYKENLTLSQLAFFQDLYVLLQEEGGYRILKLDEQMIPRETSALLKPKEAGVMTGFMADGEGFYLTLVSPRGDKVYTYFLEKEGKLKEISYSPAAEGEEAQPASEQQEVFLRLVRMKEAPKGRRIVDAAFMEGEYSIRLDNGVGKENFLLSEEILDAFYGRQLSLEHTLKFQQDKLIFYTQLLLAGYLLLFLAVVILRNRRHIVYTIVIVEAVLLVVTVMGVGLAFQVKSETRKEQSRIYGAYYLQELQRQIGTRYQSFVENPDFYTTEEYYEVWDELESFVQEEGPDRLLKRLAIVRCEDNRVMVSSEARNLEHAAYGYSTSVVPLIEFLKEGHGSASSEVQLEGSTYQVVGVAGREGLTPKYCMIGLLKPQEEGEEGQLKEQYLYYGGLIFGLGSVLSVLLILFQERDLRNLGKAMYQVANGDYEIRKGAVHGKDVETMWNSLLEIKKTITRINHAKFRLYESCYRFAPKNIEKVLGKDSITEVKSGDAVELYATLAMINCAKCFQMDIPTMHQVNRYVDLMEKHKEEKQGFFLSGNNNLKNMKMLFLQECATTTEFGVNFMKEFQQMKTYNRFKAGILLHYDHYIYGVAGSSEQSFSFMFYDKMERLEKLGQWLQKQGIKLAITDQVKNRESGTGELRYIGYIMFSQTEEKVMVYEVLDACGEEERRRKLALNGKFQKSLELFYQYDFYLARSGFSEILRDYPEDRIAKWYLFVCQKYLNGSYKGEASFELWEEEQA